MADFTQAADLEVGIGVPGEGENFAGGSGSDVGGFGGYRPPAAPAVASVGERPDGTRC